jgi:hypothetical protein
MANNGRKAVEDIILQAMGARYTWGFPMGEGVDPILHHNPILRQGLISQNGANKFLIVAGLFPGSSGSPVITKPFVNIVDGILQVVEPKLVGIAASYIPYEDVAISVQTKKPRVIFQENSGLGWAFKI